MGKTIEAIFDGKVFRPTEPVALQPNTHVRITIDEAASGSEEESFSFLQTARSLKLEGPSNWSENIRR